MKTNDENRDIDYVIGIAKFYAKTNLVKARAWMITAQTLYADKFQVQFEAYRLEKWAGNVVAAAKCFSKLLNKFSQENELWMEIDKITAALRVETENTDVEMHYLSNMFKHIPSNVQHQLLLMTADHCEDTIEHCRLLLLLLKKFPQSISTHGPRLIDTLLSAEKHSHASNQPMNCYRKLLVCELLPLLGENVIDLSTKLLYRLLHKSIEFYLCSLISPINVNTVDLNPKENWVKLFKIVNLIGRHLGWDPYLTNNGDYWNRDNYWQKILSFCQTNKSTIIDEHIFTKQMLYCLSILFLNCLYEYKITLHPEPQPGEQRTSFILVEAFVDSSLPSTFVESKSKRRKFEIDNSPYISVVKPASNQLVNNFIMASNCWDLLQSTETLKHEFIKLAGHLKLEYALSHFMVDYALYKCIYEDALIHLHAVPTDPLQILVRNLRLTCIYYCKKNFSACFEYLVHVVSALPANIGQFNNSLAIGGISRHLLYIPLTQNAILQYCVRILVTVIRENMSKQPGNYNEVAVGILMILIQLDWPQQGELFPPIGEQIRLRGSFRYPLFQTYVININLLEEIMFLRADHGCGVTFEIFPTSHAQMSIRRIGTRGADKEVKEDFKQAMRRQITRSIEPIEQLIIKFITNERIHILQTLI